DHPHRGGRVRPPTRRNRPAPLQHQHAGHGVGPRGTGGAWTDGWARPCLDRAGAGARPGRRRPARLERGFRRDRRLRRRQRLDGRQRGAAGPHRIRL
ncbi:MAG: hypothetical protein AVDCRST_MAG62-1283, partial [uncultured Sphingomonas sp.]